LLPWAPRGRPRCPYTTLFRSNALAGKPDSSSLAALAGRRAGAVGETAGLGGHGAELVFLEVERAVEHHLDGTALGQHGIGPAGEDRKSTRLNSSHVKNSYAVL